MGKNNIVKAWQEAITIPTYPVGEPDKNPMFFEKRVYQGSSGEVYPNPIIEKIYDEKADKSYTGLFLENRYLKIMILPELGGRVQMAYDKIRERHFVYYNQVIKPALVGLLGPWISGGIEFNWPQHHRPSTFQPVNFTIRENEDGSKTVWVNEVERMFRTKGMAGFTLHPDKAYLEIKVKLYNRTPLPQTFLWWANPAVSVDEHYQSVFPPDVNAVFDHGKRDVSTFPIATDTYYKVNYSPGTDISRYKNIPVPTSYMAIQSDYDFMGGYEHDTEAGLLHVADHYISPGKKQWTWGNGDFGKAWDRNLTDEDGPYIELMTGVYTDNQPDFSWLMPYEEKSFSQYFMPYQDLGVVKNATKDILINIEPDGTNKAEIKIYTTSEQKGNNVKLYIEDELVFEDSFDISPESVYKVRPEFSREIGEKNYLLIVEDNNGEELIRYKPAQDRGEEIPDPAKPAKDPKEIASTEQLYLTGLHLEQYRHATYDPTAYYKEALERDPSDVRNNNAYGRWLLHRGRFEKSKSYFRQAVETLTERNPNPYNGEPYYNLGLSLLLQDKLEEAYNAFYKSVWNEEWKAAGYFKLTQIACRKEDYKLALNHIEKSLVRNIHNHKGRHLKAVLLRKLNRYEEGLELCRESEKVDQFDFGSINEARLLLDEMNREQEAEEKFRYLQEAMMEDVHNYIEYSLDYAMAGLYKEAIGLLSEVVKEENQNEDSTYPMVYYFLGYFSHRKGGAESASDYYARAAQMSPDYCFPNRIEAVPALKHAISNNAGDSKAHYYLGNFWYANKQYKKATKAWEDSRALEPEFPTVHRNLALAYYNKRQQPGRAVKALERAFSLDRSDARVLMELDQLYKRINKNPEERLRFLENHMELVESRDDLYLERAALYNFIGQYEKAYDLFMNRKFHPWEGGEGKVSGQYTYSLTEMAKKDIRAGRFDQAVEKLENAWVYPLNLGEGKLYGAWENDIFYWLGIAWERLGNAGKAEEFWQKACEGNYEPNAAIFYNDQPPEKIFYQALAWLKLGASEKANKHCQKLIDYGKEHMDDKVKIDYFAVSLPDLLIFDDDLSRRNRIHCTFMMALGFLGLGEFFTVKSLMQEILDMEAMHFGAKSHLRLAEWFEKILHFKI